MTLRRSRPHSTQRWLGLLIAAGAISVLALNAALGHSTINAIPGNFFAVTDEGLANDVPGQVDLTQMGRDDSSATIYKLFWSWDSTDQWTGTGQTGDACALFDTDGDGFINFVACVRVNNPNADPAVVKIVPNGTLGPVFLFSCSDKKNDRCTNPSAISYTSSQASAGQIGGSSLDPAANLITDTDPFPLVGANTPHDSTVEIRILKSLIGTDPVLVNVCSYPSAGNGGNNNPFDCIVTPGTGFLQIVKDAGADTTTNFAFAISPAPVSAPANQTITGSGSTAALVMLIGNSYSVTETVPSGWTLSSAGCTITGAGGTGTGTNPVTAITVASGKVTTCTFTNSPIQPQLSLRKVVVNDNGGNNLASGWTLTATPTSGTAISGNGTQHATLNEATYGPNTAQANVEYTLTEASVSGYASSGIWSCTGGTFVSPNKVTLALGANVTCTITNNDDAPSLSLRKVVVNDAGGNNHASEWTLTATPTTGSAISGNGSPATGTDATYGPNAAVANVQYTLSESGGPSGYSTSGIWSCTAGTFVSPNKVTLAEGESATCTITNNDDAPQLSLRKVVVNDDGLTNEADEWTLTATPSTGSAISGNGTQHATLNEATYGPNTAFANVEYTLSESGGPAGYSTNGQWSCVGGNMNATTNKITLAEGESATCTITNTDDPAEPAGTTVQSWVLHDELTITGIRHGGSDEEDATVTFRLWETCDTDTGIGSDQVGIDEVIDLLLGDSAATVDGVAVEESGTYYWTAEYSGDLWNLGFTTACDDEITQIQAKDEGRDDFVSGFLEFA